MKKRLLSFIFLLVMGISAAYAQNYDFSAVVPTGQTLYYNITSSGSASEVEVTSPNWDWDGYTEPTGSLSIPSTVIHGGTSYSITSIGDYAFVGCDSLASVSIPNSVTSIGESAFSDCSSLASVTIPNSVTSIGESAFSGCSNLASVTIPNSVTYIGMDAFYDCYRLAPVTIPNTVTSIGQWAFEGVKMID